jgi:hypothetical protein
MIAESGELAEDVLQGEDQRGLMLKHVAPDISGVAHQERVVSLAQEKWKDMKSSWSLPSTNETYNFWEVGCQNWLDGVATDKRQLQIYAQQFNAVVPRANSFFVSAARLSSMQALLGATDPKALVAAVQTGLTDAAAVATKYMDIWEGGDVSKGMEALAVPTRSSSVEAEAEEVTHATEELRNSYLGFRIAMTAKEIAGVEAEGEADRKRLAEINEVKKFVREVGGMIDETMSVVSEAPVMITNFSSTLQKTGAQVNAIRNRREIMRGGRGTHNPTYLTTDDKGNMVVANMQTGMQRGAEGTETEIPESEFKLPKSVEDILGGITDFIYAKEVRDINMRLQAIANRVAAIEHWTAGAKLTEAVQKFQTALNQFAKKCTDLQQRIADRREEYLKFGIQLDRFARGHPELGREGLATGRGRERYATIMTVTAQIREMLALGRNAARGFDGDAHSFAVWAYQASERRKMSSAFSHPSDPMSTPPFWTVPSYELTPGEMSAIDSIFQQLRKFEQAIATAEKTFGSVDETAKAVLTNARLSPGGGSRNY